MEQKIYIYTFLFILANRELLTTSDKFEDESAYNFPNISTENWTSCEEFLANSTFDPQYVLDVDWKIFYFWHYTHDNSYIVRFSTPYPILIDRFRTELPKIKPPVNWNRTVLFMETSIDFSALLIATETSGRFRIVTNMAFYYNDVPNIDIGLKLVYPGYLGIMNCKYRFCYALAPVDKMPNDKNIYQEAQRIGFRGDINFSYILDEKMALNLPIYEDDDTDRDPTELYFDEGEDI